MIAEQKKKNIHVNRYSTFLGESIKGIGSGITRDRIAPPRVLLIKAATLGSDGSFDTIPLPNKQLPAEYLREAAHHVIKLIILHVQEGLHSKSKLRYLCRRVVSDPICLEQVLKPSKSKLTWRPQSTTSRRRSSCRCWWHGCFQLNPVRRHNHAS